MSSFLDECRSALRYLRRRPLFAVAVSATLAAAIAVATTAYGVARSVLWRTLPFDDATKLVFVWEDTERDGHRQASRVTGARYAAWRDESAGVASLALFGATGFTLEGTNGATSVRGVRVSANYFDTLGIRPARGRTFVPDDERPGSDRVVVLSDGFWRQHLGAREDVIGDFLRLGGQAYQVVGVMPPVAFPGWPLNPAAVTIDADSRELWVPIPKTVMLDQSARAHVFGVIGRLAPGIEPEQLAERFTANRNPGDAGFRTAPALSHFAISSCTMRAHPCRAHRRGPGSAANRVRERGKPLRFGVRIAKRRACHPCGRRRRRTAAGQATRTRSVDARRSWSARGNRNGTRCPRGRTRRAPAVGPLADASNARRPGHRYRPRARSFRGHRVYGLAGDAPDQDRTDAPWRRGPRPRQRLSRARGVADRFDDGPRTGSRPARAVAAVSPEPTSGIHD